ncbi:hypothetical protein RR48_14352 [Papilio machaon]|uniref:Uncharacterized protein n=1 Tax=Papilio machaon TaxID=76193 RepID=A0A194QM36_PAPMA|nr:hypothetical protein RR48_14352 [Papilio machaon]
MTRRRRVCHSWMPRRVVGYSLSICMRSGSLVEKFLLISSSSTQIPLDNHAAHLIAAEVIQRYHYLYFVAEVLCGKDLI